MAKYSYFISHANTTFSFRSSLHKLKVEVFIVVGTVFILLSFLSVTFQVFCVHVQSNRNNKIYKKGCCVWVSGRAIVQAVAIDGCNKIFCAYFSAYSASTILHLNYAVQLNDAG
jgi:hypothetical protein